MVWGNLRRLASIAALTVAPFTAKGVVVDVSSNFSTSSNKYEGIFIDSNQTGLYDSVDSRIELDTTGNGLIDSNITTAGSQGITDLGSWDDTFHFEFGSDGILDKVNTSTQAVANSWNFGTDYKFVGEKLTYNGNDAVTIGGNSITALGGVNAVEFYQLNADNTFTKLTSTTVVSTISDVSNYSIQNSVGTSLTDLDHLQILTLYNNDTFDDIQGNTDTSTSTGHSFSNGSSYTSISYDRQNQLLFGATNATSGAPLFLPNGGFGNGTYVGVTPVPEPSTYVGMGLVFGVVAYDIYRRRKKKLENIVESKE